MRTYDMTVILIFKNTISSPFIDIHVSFTGDLSLERDIASKIWGILFESPCIITRAIFVLT